MKQPRYTLSLEHLTLDALVSLQLAIEQWNEREPIIMYRVPQYVLTQVKARLENIRYEKAMLKAGTGTITPASRVALDSDFY